MLFRSIPTVLVILYVATQFKATLKNHAAQGLSSSATSGKDRRLSSTLRTSQDQQLQLHSVISTVNFGNDKFVELFLPANSRQFSTNNIDRGTKKSTHDGSGDVVWPSGFALSRLIAHCPALVNGQNVLELGCGLGTASAAACKYARPNHVALSDRDKYSLALAYASCVQLQRSKASVSRCHMDWSDATSWPAQDYSVLLGADVLYEAASIFPLVRVLHHYLCDARNSKETPKRAVIVDPVQQVNRDAFCFAAYTAGLEVDQEVFPGSPDLMLLSVYPIL